MKKLLLIAILSLGLFSCKKTNTQPQQPSVVNPIDTNHYFYLTPLQYTECILDLHIQDTIITNNGGYNTADANWVNHSDTIPMLIYYTTVGNQSNYGPIRFNKKWKIRKGNRIEVLTQKDVNNPNSLLGSPVSFGLYIDNKLVITSVVNINGYYLNYKY